MEGSLTQGSDGLGYLENGASKKTLGNMESQSAVAQVVCAPAYHEGSDNKSITLQRECAGGKENPEAQGNQSPGWTSQAPSTCSGQGAGYLIAKPRVHG